MFNEKTLLILGAGASKDYGFPTGNELIKDIIYNRNKILNIFLEILKEDLSTVLHEHIDNYDEELNQFQITNCINSLEYFLLDYNFLIELEHLSKISCAILDILQSEKVSYISLENIGGIIKQFYLPQKPTIDNLIRKIKEIYGGDNAEYQLDNIDKYKKSSPKLIDININQSLDPYLKTNNIRTKYKNKYSKYLKESCEQYFTALKFFQSLDEFDPTSIDFFLSIHKEFNITLHSKEKINIGKLSIVYIIDQCYKRNNITYNWYKYLLDQILRGCQGFDNNNNSNKENIKNNKLDIITFNYDTSLDNFLYNKLSNISYFNRNDKEEGNYAKDFIKEFLEEKKQQEQKEYEYKYGIIHIYGKIEYSKKQEDGHKSLIYQSQQIKVIDEDRNNEGQYSNAIEKINNANKIYIIGYGFDETNNDLINLEEIFTYSLINSDNLELKKEVYILNYNNSELINKKIRSLIKKKLHDNHQYKFKFMELKNIINLNIITRPISESINHDFNFSD